MTMTGSLQEIDISASSGGALSAQDAKFASAGGGASGSKVPKWLQLGKK
jgi:hypothetical protein